MLIDVLKSGITKTTATLHTNGGCTGPLVQIITAFQYLQAKKGIPFTVSVVIFNACSGTLLTMTILQKRTDECQSQREFALMGAHFIY